MNTREIKFRAWDKELTRMIDFNCLDSIYDCHESEMLFDLASGEITLRDCTDACYYKDKEVVLMQYTGLKDKNGKEIYEGDILFECDEENKAFILSHIKKGVFEFGDSLYDDDSECFDDGCYLIYQVYHDQKSTSYKTKYTNGDVYGDRFYLSFMVEENKAEVIGNIYENPELLENK